MNYKPWFALAEFVDNAVQSYLDCQLELEFSEGEDFQLRVDIEIRQNDGFIRVADNAAGIFEEDYDRAFVTASPPPNASGLSQFGVGLKSASAWFGRYLCVESTALGELVRRELNLDYQKIVEEEIDEISINETGARPEEHGTVLTLTGIHDMPQAGAITKIKSHLTSIYRHFLISGQLHLTYNGESLAFEPPKVLSAVPAWEPMAAPFVWQKEIGFELSCGKRVRGTAGIRAKGSRKLAGFALFRHNRLVTGSGEDTYRPEEIFRQAGGFVYQRLFGELHLDDFDVTHTKDGFRLEEHEEELIHLLELALDDGPICLIRQSLEYRVTADAAEVKPAAEKAVDAVGRSLVEGERNLEQLPSSPAAKPPELPAPPNMELISQDFDLSVDDVDWRVKIDIAIDESSTEWIQVVDRVGRVSGRLHLHLRMNLGSPFAVQFLRDASTDIEVFLRVAVAMGLAEVTAGRKGVDGAQLIRQHTNQLLAGPLASPPKQPLDGSKTLPFGSAETLASLETGS
jgi:hypothetical protein